MVTCAALGVEQLVLPPAFDGAGRAAARMGADTSAVLARLGTGSWRC